MEKANVGIVRMCGLLGVSRSGCCKWVARQEAGPTGREQRRERLRVKIHQFHAGSQGVNGAPRTCADVREGGEVVTCKMVAGIMWADGIAGISPRPWRPVTTLADQVAHAIADRVGRTGVCWDNAQMESFWSALSTGYYDCHDFATHAEAIHAVSSWIETVDNRRRRHSALGQIPPAAFEHRITTAVDAVDEAASPMPTKPGQPQRLRC